MSKKTSDSNIIYVGRKPPMNYVLGIVTAFSGSETKEVTVKARGQAITTAVEAVEIARRSKRNESSQNRDRNRRDATKRRGKQLKDDFNNRNHPETIENSTYFDDRQRLHHRSKAHSYYCWLTVVTWLFADNR